MPTPEQVLEFAKRVLKDRREDAVAATGAIARGTEAAAAGESGGARRGGIGLESMSFGLDEVPQFGPEVPRMARELEAGAEVLEDLDNMDPNELTREQQVGLEAIILLQGRPALLVQKDDYVGDPGVMWQDKLEKKRAEIKQLFTRVGRIEARGQFMPPFVGTGFVVAKNVIMTNRHVAVTFVRERNLKFLPGIKPGIDYKQEHRVDAKDPADIVECIGIHEDYDLALLRLSDAAAARDPLTVAGEKPEFVKDRDVLVIGYPAFDSRNDPNEMVRIFNNIFNVKRLQPGTLTEVVSVEELNIVGHDASTLGGNSGSGVFDYESGKVLGLHFGGRYLEGNNAVPLWMLTEDALLKKAGVNFG
jgi:hypothetical protein